ncbi:hypothetical protein VCHENC02_5430B, partial [Vibrio harveyi]
TPFTSCSAEVLISVASNALTSLTTTKLLLLRLTGA